MDLSSPGSLVSFVGAYSFVLFVIRVFYVVAKATYIRLLHGKIGFLGFFWALAPYKGVGPI